jgi:hypothetical protein
MKDGKKQSRSNIWQRLTFAGVLALGFTSGWIIEHSKPPPNLNQPKYEVYYGKDKVGHDVVAFRDWSGSNTIVVPAIEHEKAYEICFGRTADGGSIMCTRDIHDTNSQWVPIYKYDLAFGREEGNAIIAVRE